VRDLTAVRRLVFLHGFTQTHHHWHRPAHLLAEALGDHPTLAFVDLPGHGSSSGDRTHGIDEIGHHLTSLAGRGTYLGYSLGGRTALVAAADGDPRIERLVLVGATPGIADDAERAERSRLDEERARRVEELGVDGFLAEWLSMPMFAGLPDDPSDRRARSVNTVGGLAHSLRRHGTGAQTPRWSSLGNIEIPVLVLAGEHDAKFVAIGEEMAGQLSDGEFAVVPGAGHAAHTEAPAALVDLIADWLA
jgi:2-succinyl-6-hydroxy-2,4-cyclohexadiene-1-carboxylate synthase